MAYHPHEAYVKAGEYAEHIRELSESSVRQMDLVIESIVDGKSVECVDDNCEHGAPEVPGSLWLLYSYGFIEQLGSALKKAQIQRIRVLTHEDCGFLAVMQALYSREAQNQWADGRFLGIGGANRNIKSTLKNQFGVVADFRPRDPRGSATDYMEYMRSVTK